MGSAKKKGNSKSFTRSVSESRAAEAAFPTKTDRCRSNTFVNFSKKDESRYCTVANLGGWPTFIAICNTHYTPKHLNLSALNPPLTPPSSRPPHLPDEPQTMAMSEGFGVGPLGPRSQLDRHLIRKRLQRPQRRRRKSGRSAE